MNSSSADRRLYMLSRHLAGTISNEGSGISSSPTSAGNSVFANVVRAPEDPILGVTVAYNKDPSPVKLNLGVGAYRTEEGKPLVLNVVRKAEQLLVNDRSRVKEYLPIVGLADFNKLSAKLILGADSPAIQGNRVTTVQCLSGTGSLRVGAEFLSKHYYQRTIYLPNPTWGNHTKIFTLAGLTVKTYRYYDPVTRGLNIQGLLEDLGSAPSGSIILLHACAHNPTGVDPTLDQWEQIRQLIRSKSLLPFFDSAYQGFASGSLDKDAQSVRMFVRDGGECFIAQSYAKNMGLYGERVGALSIVCRTADVASRVESQLKLVIRPMYSNPPIHGASIVATILKDRNLYHEWTLELKAMADRIITMRKKLFDALTARGTPGDWSHIIKQIGMFTFTGLNTKQVNFMTKEYHIYMTSDGRISMAGLSSRTVPHLADAIHAAVTIVDVLWNNQFEDVRFVDDDSSSVNPDEVHHEEDDAEDNKLNALFWADETSKLHYMEFGDVVSFDATYSTNRYDLVFFPFTGIDNHKRCVTFGAGLLSREDADSYIWLLKSFLKVFVKQPILVLSDQDPTMKKAISCVFPNSFHRLCMWHITSKLPLKICVDTMKNSNFKFRFLSLVWNMKIDVKQFEEEWDILLEDHGLSDDKWLNAIYDRRHSWLPVYFMDVPMSGLMRTTSRSEGQNSSFQNSTQKGSMLFNFMTSFETSMEKQMYEQSVLDFKSNQKIPKMKTVLPLELNASKYYTCEVFVQVQREIFHSLMACTVTSMVDDGVVDLFSIREKKGRRPMSRNEENDSSFEWDNQLKEAQFEVFFNKEEKSFKCTCMLYEHIGILCRHIFCVFKFYDYDDIPAKYVLRRWRKDIIPTEMLRRGFRYGDMSQSIDQVVLEVYGVVDYCVSTLSYDKKKLEGFLTKLSELKSIIEYQHSNQVIIDKKDEFEKLLGVSTPNVIDIHNPSGIRNKGCGTRKRMRSIKEVVIEKVSKDRRTCTWCWKYVHHDARNCDDRKKGLPRASTLKKF